MAEQENFRCALTSIVFYRRFPQAPYDNQYAFLQRERQNAIDAVRIPGRSRQSRTERRSVESQLPSMTKFARLPIMGLAWPSRNSKIISGQWGAGSRNHTGGQGGRLHGIVFIIGGFANFGTCDTLEVVSRSGVSCSSNLFVSVHIRGGRFALPTVNTTMGLPSSAVEGLSLCLAGARSTSTGLLSYLRQFVRYVREPIYYQGELISQNLPDSKRNATVLSRNH